MESFAKPKALHQVLCGILGTVISGCDTLPDPNALAPTSDWQGISCDTNNNIDLLTGLNPIENVDGLLLYQTGGQIGNYLRDAGGTPCGQAVDVTQCNQTLESLLFSFDSNALIYTKGDIVQVLINESEVKSFLGQLDNPEKVFSWMHVHGMSLSCTFNDSAVIAGDDGKSWTGIYTELTQVCSPIVKERVRVKIDVEDWSIKEIARAEIQRTEGVCIGRKPPGSLSFFGGKECSGNNSLGLSLARHAAYEAASVIAFNHLKKELEILGAPQSLLLRIEKAADDERRHAIQVSKLARHYDKEAAKFSVKPSPLRDIESIAIDNMKEGCIGETWGALVGLYQAKKAKDRSIAETMLQIALDEIDHASLSWEIHEWLIARLDDNARQRIYQAQESAVKKLTANAIKPVEHSHVVLAGLPEPHVAKQLAEKLIASLPSSSVCVQRVVIS